LEKIIPSFEDRISTDENDLQENLSKINSKIKSKKEISLKILNEINTEKTKGIEEIFGNLNGRKSDIDFDTEIFSVEGEDLKKFIFQNFELSEKVLKFLFIGGENTGKTWTLNLIKNFYKQKDKSEFECKPTTR